MTLTVLSPGIGYGKVHTIEKSNEPSAQPTETALEIQHFLDTKQAVFQALENLKNQQSTDEIIGFQQAILLDQLLENEVKQKNPNETCQRKRSFQIGHSKLHGCLIQSRRCVFERTHS